MKAAILIAVLSILPITSYAALAENYECQRTDISRNTISYPLTVMKTGDTYTLQWTVDGKPAFYGTGVVHPKIDNAITVVFWDPKNTDIYGVELFKINTDGSLSADWAMQSETQMGSETCTKK